MLRNVRVEHRVNDQTPGFKLQVVLHVLHNVALRVGVKDLEACGQVMVLQHADIRVTYCKRVLSPDDELV